MGRGDWEAADALLRQAYAEGEQMAELNRLSPPLWGLAEAARCQGDHSTAITLCERGYQASAPVTGAAYLFQYLLTGVRAYLAHGGIAAAENWSDRVSAEGYQPDKISRLLPDAPAPPADDRYRTAGYPVSGLCQRISPKRAKSLRVVISRAPEPPSGLGSVP
jgi:hypothetical protein